MGFAPGSVYAVQETPIPAALGGRASGVTTEEDGRSTLLMRLSNRRGHDLGWIGLSLPPGVSIPDAEALSARMATLFETSKPEEVDA